MPGASGGIRWPRTLQAQLSLTVLRLSAKSKLLHGLLMVDFMAWDFLELTTMS